MSQAAKARASSLGFMESSQESRKSNSSGMKASQDDFVPSGFTNKNKVAATLVEQNAAISGQNTITKMFARAPPPKQDKKRGLNDMTKGADKEAEPVKDSKKMKVAAASDQQVKRCNLGELAKYAYDKGPYGSAGSASRKKVHDMGEATVHLNESSSAPQSLADSENKKTAMGISNTDLKPKMQEKLKLIDLLNKILNRSELTKFGTIMKKIKPAKEDEIDGFLSEIQSLIKV